MAKDDPVVDPAIYAPRYRAARAFARRSREEVAQALGLSYETIKRRELGIGEEAPRPPERRALALFCGVPPEFIEYGFDGVDYSQAKRTAVTRLGESAARAENADGDRRGRSQAPRGQDTPEAPEADAR